MPEIDLAAAFGPFRDRFADVTRIEDGRYSFRVVGTALPRPVGVRLSKSGEIWTADCDVEHAPSAGSGYYIPQGNAETAQGALEALLRKIALGGTQGMWREVPLDEE